MSAGGEYLWDGRGEPDADVERLEGALRGMRFGGAPLDVTLLAEREPAEFVPARKAPPAPPGTWQSRRGFAAAAGLLLAVVGAWVGRGAAEGWTMDRASGNPRVATVGGGRSSLPVGAWLETDAVSRARLAVGEIGHVTVEPGSRVRIRKAGASRQVLELARGRIDAVIVAPPRLFVVEGPGVRAVDLGCAYTLEVDEGGVGVLRVTMGFVELERDGVRSVVPRGARCATRAARGPGTPYFEDADPTLVELVRGLDDGPTDGKVVEALLGSARERDALTLWHLISRVNPELRGAVVDRLSDLVPLPAGVSRQAVLGLSPPALDAWWHALSF